MGLAAAGIRIRLLVVLCCWFCRCCSTLATTVGGLLVLLMHAHHHRYRASAAVTQTTTPDPEPVRGSSSLKLPAPPPPQAPFFPHARTHTCTHTRASPWLLPPLACVPPPCTYAHRWSACCAPGEDRAGGGAARPSVGCWVWAPDHWHCGAAGRCGRTAPLPQTHSIITCTIAFPARVRVVGSSTCCPAQAQHSSTSCGACLHACLVRATRMADRAPPARRVCDEGSLCMWPTVAIEGGDGIGVASGRRRTTAHNAIVAHYTVFCGAHPQVCRRALRCVPRVFVAKPLGWC